ncbi:MAG: TlpA disulfide reductase family protein [Pirellulaceae bacterium]|nr:TlpA disulfide reductase family protein [Pirellulaceae bacterium]
MYALRWLRNRFSSCRLIALLGLISIVSCACPNRVSAQEQAVQEQTDLEKMQTAQGRSLATAEVLRYVTQGDLPKAIEILEQLRSVYPDNLEIKLNYFRRIKSYATQLVTSGKKAEGYELHKQAAQLAREIEKQFADMENISEESLANFRTNNSYLFYNEGCAFAVEGEHEKCIASLREAVQRGFNNMNFMLNDMDLLEISERPDFQEMLGEELVNYKARLRESILESIGNFQQTNFDVSFPNLSGELQKLSDQGDKLKVVTFWSPSNGPSQKNLAVLNRLKQKFAVDDLTVLSVACVSDDESQATFDNLKTYLTERDLDIECLVAGPHVRRQLKHSRGFPTTVIVDEKGKLRATFPGILPYHVVASFAEILLEGIPVPVEEEKVGEENGEPTTVSDASDGR